jgi:hypothetical protein
MRKRPLRSNRIPILTLPRENKSGDNMPSLLGLRGFAPNCAYRSSVNHSRAKDSGLTLKSWGGAAVPRVEAAKQKAAGIFAPGFENLWL